MRKLLLPLLLMTVAALMGDSMVIFEFPDGRSVAMTSSGDVAMAAESVSVFPSPDPPAEEHHYSHWLPPMRVRCVFTLVNLSNESQEITVGFPLDAKYGDAYSVFPDSMLVARYDSIRADEERPLWFKAGPGAGEDASPNIPEEMDFTTVVDGDTVEVLYRTCGYSVYEQLVHRPVVAVWRMHFQPRDTVTLVNTYNTSWDYYGTSASGRYTIRYILTTGATWEGPIGDAVVSLEVPESLPEPQLSDSLMVCWEWTGRPVVQGRRITWHYTGFEPEENLAFTISRIKTDPIFSRPSPEQLVNATDWEPGRILSSAGIFIMEDLVWGQRYHSELVLKLLENSLDILQGEQIGHPDLEQLLSSTGAETGDSSEERAEMLREVRLQLERDVQLISREGYADLLPLFTVKDFFVWRETDLDRYAAMPEMEERYLDILQQLESAKLGLTLQDSVMAAFFRLTGWYVPGEEAQCIPEIGNAVQEYRDLQGY